jgi:putative two-component system response regulator
MYNNFDGNIPVGKGDQMKEIQCNKQKIVLTNVNEEIGGQLAEILQNDYDVMLVTDKEMLEEVLNAEQYKISLLLTGMMMQNVENRILFQRLRACHVFEHMPVLALTDGSEEQVECACGEGALDVIAPPYTERVVQVRCANVISLYLEQINWKSGKNFVSEAGVQKQFLEILKETAQAEVQICNLKYAEVARLERYLGQIFDLVRLVHVEKRVQISIDSEGNVAEYPCHCYGMWNREKACTNCISSRVLREKTKVFKYEFSGQDLYYIMAAYVEVEGQPYALETAFKITNEKILPGHSKVLLFNAMNDEDKKLYVDSLTEAYNRRYYDDVLSNAVVEHGVVMVDVDDFKNINDKYGHMIGDKVLRKIAKVIGSCIRREDTLVRFGGDEFSIVFFDLPETVFENKLNQICQAVKEMEIPEEPDLKTSVSIGGIYRKGAVCKLLEEADALMYQAKKEKNAVRIQ